MQLHEVQIEHADNLAKINSLRLTQADRKSIALAATASITLKSSEMIRMTDKALDRANDILSKSYSKLLSRKSVSLANLSSILDKIYLKRRKTESAPLFSGENSYDGDVRSEEDTR